MKLQLYIQNNNDNNTYDISTIAQQTQISKSLDGTAGKLTTILQKDPNNLLKIANGSQIHFIVDGKPFFFGYVFKIGTDMDTNYKITCYDSMRYLKNSDNWYSKRLLGLTASQIFEQICNQYELKYEIKVPTKYVPPIYNFTNKSLYTIAKRGMDLASINDKKHYFITTEYDKLVWSEISYEGERLGIQLGDSSLVTSYTYEKSIDDDTYNQVKLYRPNKETGNDDAWIVRNPENIKKWGILQLLKQADDKLNSAQIKQQAEKYLEIKNRETETLKIQADGYIDCVPGKLIRFILSREGIDRNMWITSCTHTFTKEAHVMDLELEAGI